MASSGDSRPAGQLGRARTAEKKLSKQLMDRHVSGAAAVTGKPPTPAGRPSTIRNSPLVLVATFETGCKSTQQTACSVDSGALFRPDCTLSVGATSGRVRAAFHISCHQKSAGTLRPQYRFSGSHITFATILVAQTKHQSDVAEVATSTKASFVMMNALLWEIVDTAMVV